MIKNYILLLAMTILVVSGINEAIGNRHRQVASFDTNYQDLSSEAHFYGVPTFKSVDTDETVNTEISLDEESAFWGVSAIVNQ